MSNHWVISGEHTESGKPLHVNDFHSGPALPIRMTIAELSWGEHSVHGGHFAGIPGTISGRNKNFSWSMTTGLDDSTDLWEEQLNEDKTMYKVDGEWRNLTVEEYEFFPLGKNESTKRLQYSTHRGPLFKYEELRRFVGSSPRLNGKMYSLAWPCHRPGETSYEFLF